MEETKQRLSLSAVLGVVVLVLAVAAFWAASAFAGGGSGANEPGARDSPTASTVQNENGTPDDDCPDGERQSEESSDV